MIIKYLNWDSNFFNKRVGELYIDEANNKVANIVDFDLLYLKSAKDISIDLKGFDNTFVENKVLFSKTILGSEKDIFFDIESVHDVDFDINQLYELAFESGKFSRYKLDENFSNKVFLNIYQLWIDNSLNKTFADDILVYLEKGKIYGLITYKIYKDYAKVGLLGIDPNTQGKGIGTKLIKKLESKIYNLGLSKISIPTQLKNIQACNFYTKLGYSIKEKIVIKHYWKI